MYDSTTHWGRAGRSVLLWLALLAFSLGLSACASLPGIDREAVASHAIDLSASTTLGRIAKASSPDDEQSNLRLMPLGFFSLDARLELARRARPDDGRPFRGFDR